MIELIKESNTMKKRCYWLDETKPDYVTYHDEEWGVPVYDDHTLFEFITLELAQAGLSWYTILKKRAGYREAFYQFDVNQVASMDEHDIDRLMHFTGIVRNRLKIAATINNAKRFLEIQKEFGSFSNYQWQFVGGQPDVSNLNNKVLSELKPPVDALSSCLLYSNNGLFIILILK